MSVNIVKNNKLKRIAGNSQNDDSIFFESSDILNPGTWSDIPLVENGEKHTNLCKKFSLAVKNLRYLYRILGNTDITHIADGTVTGAIHSLNSNVKIQNGKSGDIIWYKCGNLCTLFLTNDQRTYNKGYIANGIPVSKHTFVLSDYNNNVFSIGDGKVYTDGVDDKWCSFCITYVCT